MDLIPTEEAILGSVAALAAVGVAWGLRRRSLGIGWFVAFAFALLIGGGHLTATVIDDLVGRLFVAGCLAVAVVALATAVARPGSDIRRMTVLWVAAGVGVYVCVPDTEEVVLVGAGVTVLALCAWLVAAARVSDATMGSLAALFVVAAVLGARGRPESVVGALAAIAVPILAPPLELLVGRGGDPRRLAVAPAAVIGLAAAVTSGRVAGIDRSWGEATRLAALIVGVGLVCWAVGLAVPALRMPAGQASASRRS